MDSHTTLGGTSLPHTSWKIYIYTCFVEIHYIRWRLKNKGKHLYTHITRSQQQVDKVWATTVLSTWMLPWSQRQASVKWLNSTWSQAEVFGIRSVDRGKPVNICSWLLHALAIQLTAPVVLASCSMPCPTFNNEVFFESGSSCCWMLAEASTIKLRSLLTGESEASTIKRWSLLPGVRGSSRQAVDVVGNSRGGSDAVAGV